MRCGRADDEVGRWTCGEWVGEGVAGRGEGGGVAGEAHGWVGYAAEWAPEKYPLPRLAHDPATPFPPACHRRHNPPSGCAATDPPQL